MAKKYIFFKLSPTIIDDQENTKLSRLELESFLSSVKPIRNVFELLTFPDLKLSIEKDHQLQHDLILALPGGYLHGYIATTHEFFNVEKIVKRLAYFNEVYLFQRTVENADTYLFKIL